MGVIVRYPHTFGHVVFPDHRRIALLKTPTSGELSSKIFWPQEHCSPKYSDHRRFILSVCVFLCWSRSRLSFSVHEQVSLWWAAEWRLVLQGEEGEHSLTAEPEVPPPWITFTAGPACQAGALRHLLPFFPQSVAKCDVTWEEGRRKKAKVVFCTILRQCFYTPNHVCIHMLASQTTVGYGSLIRRWSGCCPNHASNLAGDVWIKSDLGKKPRNWFDPESVI